VSPILVIVLGVTVLTVAGIAFGGTFLLRVAQGGVPANDLQKSFFRAGHAHAGVLVTLGLLLAVLTDAAEASPGWSAGGTLAVLTAAILVPAGFFLSVLGPNPARPGKMLAAAWLGAASLTVGVVISGVVLLVAGIGAL
jgi:Ni,Fe-hydrogenase I cytochrome b subunit